MKSIPTSIRANILILSESGHSARQIASKTGLGKSTVARVIKEALPEKENVKLGHPSKLSSLNKRRIVSSALKYMDWTVEDWTRVIWPDETKINRIGLDGRMYVWKKAGEPLQNKEVQGTVKFEGGSLCMGWNGVGILEEVEGRMDAEQYVFILEDNLLFSMENSRISEESIIFQ